MSSWLNVATNLPAITDICPTAPPGVESYVAEVLGWAKWMVIAGLVASGILSAGAIGVGWLTETSRVAQRGTRGLSVTIVAAIVLVTIYALTMAIVGSGCGS